MNFERKKCRLKQIVPFLFLIVSLLSFASFPVSQFYRVPMSDGTELATDVYLPDGQEGPFPVFLVRSTYGRVLDVKKYLDEGYAVVIQDVRGMGESPGEKFVFHADGWDEKLHDGVDTVNWIIKQPWCSGKIGTFGGSALGITQTLLAPATDKISAQHIDVGTGSLYHNSIYEGGVFRKNMMEGWLQLIGQPYLVDMYKSHPLYDEFWKQFDSNVLANRITAPALFVGGWYDIFQQATIDAFLAREKEGSEKVRGKNYLIMKWSSHGPDITQDYKLNPNRFDLHISHISYAFFDYHLKGNVHALDNIPKVHYYVMGSDKPHAPGNCWRTADSWPPFESKELCLFLTSNRKLENKPVAGGNYTLDFIFDPRNPYPTHGGANLLLPSGPFDQRKYSKLRKDLLKFSSDPLQKPLEVTGRVKVILFVSSDAPDTDFTAKLLDIYPEPDGREILVLDSIRRVKTRDSFDQFSSLLNSPSEIVRLEIDLFSISWIFDKGHRIGLHISSSNYPKYEINPNTGEDFPKSENLHTAHNWVYCGETYPSMLVLPIPEQK
ncbi:MAG: CocE/NonD family hydrolase [Candidatus Hydrogenedens sp.]